MTTPEATRERQRKEDARALKRFKRDPEALPQVQRNIDARERSWAREDEQEEKIGRASCRERV